MGHSKKKKRSDLPPKAFEARFTGKTPCYKCRKLVEKGSLAMMDYTTGTKQVIHHACKDLEADIALALPDWPATDEQQFCVDTVVGYLQWTGGITTPETWKASHRVKDLLSEYASNINGHGLPPLRMKFEALAGSGKTSTLKLILASIQDQFPPNQPFALYLVFNSRNASEAAFDIPATIAWSKTLHSFGFYQIKEAFRTVKIEAKKIEYLYKDHIKDWTEDMCWEDREKELSRFIKMDRLIGHAKNNRLTPNTLPGKAEELDTFFELFLPKPEDDPAFMTDCTTLFQASIDDKFRVDFHDMLYFLWKYHLELKIPESVKFIMVDEFQDQNDLRIWLVEELAAMNYNVIVVGDRNQAIMGFSGALCDAMDKADDALGPYTVSLPLTTCLRCKNLYIIEFIRERFVPNIQAAPDAEYLEPVTTYGEEDFHTVMNMLRPGDAVISRVNAPNVKMYFKLLAQQKLATVLGTDYVEQLYSLFDKLERDYNASTPAEFYEAAEIWYAIQEEKHGKKPWKLALLEDHAMSIQAICGNMSADDDLGQIKRTLKGMFSDSGPGKSASLVTLTSAHKAKGLEWKRVFILERVNGKGMFPHPFVTNPELITQEKNLLGSVASLRGSHSLAFFAGDFQDDQQ